MRAALQLLPPPTTTTTRAAAAAATRAASVLIPKRNMTSESSAQFMCMRVGRASRRHQGVCRPACARPARALAAAKRTPQEARARAHCSSALYSLLATRYSSPIPPHTAVAPRFFARPHRVRESASMARRGASSKALLCSALLAGEHVAIALVTTLREAWGACEAGCQAVAPAPLSRASRERAARDAGDGPWERPQIRRHRCLEQLCSVPRGLAVSRAHPHPALDRSLINNTKQNQRSCSRAASSPPARTAACCSTPRRRPSPARPARSRRRARCPGRRAAACCRPRRRATTGGAGATTTTTTTTATTTTAAGAFSAAAEG